MKKLSLLSIAGFLIATNALIAPPCRAEQCPWLNAATASGFLGGEATMSVTPLTVKGDATCEFALTQSAHTFTLRIAVHTMSQPSQEYSAFVAKCDGVKTPLRTIGNEAVYCVASGRNGAEQIVGRVRDRAFLISIASVSSVSGTKDRGSPSEEAINLAQQVAGALF
jgi:hypothetical protein